MKNLNENEKIMFAEYPDLLTVIQMKDMLGIGITLAYRLVKTNLIESIKIGRAYKIPKANVIKFLCGNVD